MRVGLISDVHTRHGTRLPEIPENLDLLVLAGDVGETEHILHRIKNSWSKGARVAYLPGNHEYYGFDFDSVHGLYDNSDILFNRGSLLIGNKTIHFATLWSHLRTPQEEYVYKWGLNDCKMIRGWSPQRQNQEHLETVKWLWDVTQPGDLIFTHHSPHFSSVVPKWKGSEYNCCFHTDLSDFIKEKKPSLWGHGHIHDPVDYMFEETRVVANPCGYPIERRGLGDYKCLVLEV